MQINLANSMSSFPGASLKPGTAGAGEVDASFDETLLDAENLEAGDTVEVSGVNNLGAALLAGGLYPNLSAAMTPGAMGASTESLSEAGIQGVNANGAGATPAWQATPALATSGKANPSAVANAQGTFSLPGWQPVNEGEVIVVDPVKLAQVGATNGEDLTTVVKNDLALHAETSGNIPLQSQKTQLGRVFQASTPTETLKIPAADPRSQINLPQDGTTRAKLTIESQIDSVQARQLQGTEASTTEAMMALGPAAILHQAAQETANPEDQLKTKLTQTLSLAETEVKQATSETTPLTAQRLTMQQISGTLPVTPKELLAQNPNLLGAEVNPATLAPINSMVTPGAIPAGLENVLSFSTVTGSLLSKDTEEQVKEPESANLEHLTISTKELGTERLGKYHNLDDVTASQSNTGANAPFDMEKVAHHVNTFFKDKGNQEITMQLRPEELGNVTMHVKQEGDELRVHMVVENSAAKQALESYLPELRERLINNPEQQFNQLNLAVDVEQHRSPDRQWQEPHGGYRGDYQQERQQERLQAEAPVLPRQYGRGGGNSKVSIYA